MLSVEDIRNKRGEILDVARQHGAGNVRIFGSVLRNQADQCSDLDLLVTMAPDRSLLDRIALMRALEDLLQVKVDVTVTHLAWFAYDLRVQIAFFSCLITAGFPCLTIE